MKRISLFFLLSVFLVSCANPAPVVTATPQPTTTFTPLPTLTPTITPTSTETPDPNMPADATGRDSKTGEWTKPNPEDPNKPFHYKNIEELTQGWFKDIVINPTYQGGMPLTDEKGFGTAAGLHVWCEENLKCPSLQHLDTSDVVVNPSGPSFTRVLLPVIRTQAQKLHPEYSDFATFMKDFDDGKISLPFTTARGDTYEYKIRPESSMNIYVVKDMPNPDLSRAYVNARYSGDDQGNFNVEVHSSKAIESLSHDEFVSFLFGPTLSIFWTSDLSQWSIINTWIQPNLHSLLNLAIEGDNPYFVITP